MKIETLKKWKENLSNGFDVDLMYATQYKQLSAIKRIDLNSEYFLEMSISYNTNKDLITSIDLNRKVSQEKENMFLAQTVRTLYSDCLSKNDRISNDKIFRTTEKGFHLEAFSTLIKEYKNKLQNNENL